MEKIIKLTLDEVNRYRNEETCIKKEENTYSSWCEYNSEVSGKMKKMFLNILDYYDNIDVRIDSDRIVIEASDIGSLKKATISSSSSMGQTYPPSKYSSYFSIEVLKNKGFSIYKENKKRIYYLDDKIYDELIDNVKDVIKKNSSINFNELWAEVMKESGMIRDNNLESLFEEKEK